MAISLNLHLYFLSLQSLRQKGGKHADYNHTVRYVFTYVRFAVFISAFFLSFNRFSVLIFPFTYDKVRRDSEQLHSVDYSVGKFCYRLRYVPSVFYRFYCPWTPFAMEDSLCATTSDTTFTHDPRKLKSALREKIPLSVSFGAAIFQNYQNFSSNFL